MRGASPPTHWEEHVDPASGKKFYFNPATNETSWTKPPSRAAGYPSAKKSDGWTEHRDPASGKMFYFNAETKETSWQKPAQHGSNGLPSYPSKPDHSDPWTEHVDPDSGRTFYYNSLTKESAWLRPGRESPDHRSLGYQKPTAPVVKKPLPPPMAPSAPSAPGAPSTPSAPPPPAPPGRAASSPVPPPPTRWEEHVDPGSGRRFFFNPVTQESSWTKPGSPTSCPCPPASPTKRSDGWTEHRDPASGKVYYFNVETKETSWHKPVDAKSEWTEHVDDSGRTFYYNSQTKESSWSKPAAVAKETGDWEEHADHTTGQKFYFNRSTGQSSWEKPRASSSSELLLLLCFDFDCTIAAIHVFEAQTQLPRCVGAGLPVVGHWKRKWKLQEYIWGYIGDNGKENAN